MAAWNLTFQTFRNCQQRLACIVTLAIAVFELSSSSSSFAPCKSTARAKLRGFGSRRQPRTRFRGFGERGFSTHSHLNFDDDRGDLSNEDEDRTDHNEEEDEQEFDPFSVLGIPKTADIDEQLLRKTYRTLAKKYHPDVPKTGNAEKFEDIKFAVEELGSVQRRAVYLTKARTTHKNARMPRGQTLMEDFWEFRSRDFFAEIELELAQELQGFGGFGEHSNDQMEGRQDTFKTYWAEFQEKQSSPEEEWLDWMERKRKQRQMMIRQKLRGVSPLRNQAQKTQFKASESTLIKVREIIAAWLGTPLTMLTPEMTLQEIGFFNDEVWTDVSQCLMCLEYSFGNDELVDVDAKAGSGRILQLPTWVKSVAHLADFIQGKI
eukprot:TRINITY_DN103218_c0_g1_i1.p1 TRINITY_DN103218_c0_g1~~TRINITY_DN103218_c0_g1_i1.p1  ORF type:complete len:377 (-),score=71.82 TRINITY_DN103218_c0_g1_i1:316-1446(-)